jgi:hypothetical protein
VAAGLAFCTLEVAAALLITLSVGCFFERQRWRVDSGFIAQSVALFLATVMVVWPAALFRLSFVKAYAVMVYHSALREVPWGSASFIETWRNRFLHSPFEWVLIVASVIVWAAHRRRNVYPVGLFAALVLVGTVRVLTNTPRYSLAFMPALDLLAGLALVPSIGPLRRPASLAVVTLAVAGLCGNAWYQDVHQPHNPNPRSAAVLTYIHQNELENKAVLAPQADLPTLHYYFPGMRPRAYFRRAPSVAERSDFAAKAIIAVPEP